MNSWFALSLEASFRASSFTINNLFSEDDHFILIFIIKHSFERKRDTGKMSSWTNLQKNQVCWIIQIQRLLVFVTEQLTAV